MWISQRDPNWPLPDRPDHPFYADVLREAREEGNLPLFREAALNDLWFFCRYVLSLGQRLCEDVWNEHYGKPWLDHPWLFERCREIQADPNGNLDLWPRYHDKTALITQSLTVWDLCDNPNVRFAIITYKIDTVGSSFLKQIKEECEKNELLRRLFPATFWSDPQRQSPQWTLDALCMKQNLNPKEPTISLGSLKAGLTGMHVNVRVWDDIVTEENVRSSDAIDDTTLRVRNFAGTGADYTLDRYTGTHWAVGDTWDALLNANLCRLRYHDLYREDGETPVLYSKQWCEQMYRHMTLIEGTSHWDCVMRNKPELSGEVHFERNWLQWYDGDPLELRKKLNCYILIDTATSKKKDSDFTVLAVVGLAKGVPLGHYYLLDMVRDRIGLVQLTEHVFRLVDKWKPSYVLIEQQGAARDAEHIRGEIEDRGQHFRLRAFEDKMPKIERIKRSQPVYEAGRMHLPRRIDSRTEGRPVDLVERFLNVEYLRWRPSNPSKYDDMLDVLAHLQSPSVKSFLRFPVEAPLPYEEKAPDAWEAAKRSRPPRVQSGMEWVL